MWGVAKHVYCFLNWLQTKPLMFDFTGICDPQWSSLVLETQIQTLVTTLVSLSAEQPVQDPLERVLEWVSTHRMR